MDEDVMQLDETHRNLLDAMRYFVGNICESKVKPKTPTPEFVSALTGLCYTLVTEHLPKELLAFAHHAGQKSIRNEDMFLYCRKTTLQEHLKEYCELLPPPPKPALRAKKGAASPKANPLEDLDFDD